MKAIIRRKSSMMGKVLEFERAYPSEDASHTALVTRLGEVVSQITARFTEALTGSDQRHAATVQRKALRRQLVRRARHVEAVVRAASETTPALLEVFTPAPRRASNREFIIAVRRLIELATIHQEVLIAAGLGNSVIGELATLLEQFDAISTAADAGLRERITANADLLALTADGMALVGLLDGLNAIRFEGQPVPLAAYTSARNVFGPFTRGGELLDEEITGTIPPAPRADDAAA